MNRLLAYVLFVAPSSNQRDSDFFQTYIQKEGGVARLGELAETQEDSRKRIRENALCFLKGLQDLPAPELLRLAQFVATKCYLVVVATSALDSAYRTFSVLNSRGLDIEPTDTLKSEILSEIPQLTREHYTVSWESTEADLGREKFAEVFSHIRMVHLRRKAQEVLIKEFREYVIKGREPAAFIDDILVPMARAYSDLLTCGFQSTSDAEPLNERLKWLNRLEFTDWVPPALAFTTLHRQNLPAMVAFFADLDRLAYAQMLLGSGVNRRIERFSKLTAAVLDCGDLHDPVSPLQLTPGEQQSVYAALDGSLYFNYQARACSTLLLRLDSLPTAAELHTTTRPFPSSTFCRKTRQKTASGWTTFPMRKSGNA